MTLKDKIVVVTGGSGLIGRAILENIQNKGGFYVNVDLNAETDLERGSFKADITDEIGRAHV
mgnify:FL=1